MLMSNASVKPQVRQTPATITEATIRAGLHHLRFTDAGTPGGRVLQWRPKSWCFTDPGGFTPEGGWVDHKGGRIAVAWDPIERRDRPVEVSIHYKNGGLRGRPDIRMRDTRFHDAAKVRVPGFPTLAALEPWNVVDFPSPLYSFFYPVAYPDRPLVYLEVEVVGRVGRGPRTTRGVGSDGSCERAGEPCGFLASWPTCVYCGGARTGDPKVNVEIKTEPQGENA
jgi:hypothetical protein